jgi:hypothetical protein
MSTDVETENPVRKAAAVLAGGLAALVAAALQAHHSGSMYQTTPTWVHGTVVGVERINPHTIITLEDTAAAGEVRRWAVEGPAESQLDRLGLDMPNVGDLLEFCAFAYKPVAELSRLFPGVDFSARRALAADGSSPQFVVGHVRVSPDGEKQLWEPHGTLAECIRSSADQRQSWVDFLNAAPRARQGWCEQRRFDHVRSNVSLQQLVEEIDSGIERPCE